MRVSIHTVLLGVALVAFVSAPACREKPAAKEHGSERGEPAGGHHADEVKLSAEAIQRYGVKVEPVSRHVLVPTLLVPARVSFNTEAMAHVGSPLHGRVTELKVKVGDSVRKGDALLVIESPELGEAQSDYLQKRAAAQGAGPAVELARSAHERARGLYDKSQGIALTDVQRREADYRAAQAAFLAAQTAASAAENKLHLFGMDQASVEALAASGEVTPRFSIAAPMVGQ